MAWQRAGSVTGARNTARITDPPLNLVSAEAVDEPVPINSKSTALNYLSALERAYEIGGMRWSRHFGVWWSEAGEEERLAMLDILRPLDEPRSDNPYAHSAAARAFAELSERRASFRTRYLDRRFLRDDAP